MSFFGSNHLVHLSDILVSVFSERTGHFSHFHLFAVTQNIANTVDLFAEYVRKQTLSGTVVPYWGGWIAKWVASSGRV